ncbi:unnamed protein product [Phyllotreta striolata]|uniref:Uncharacterized protein n=1 Tax=Phyllotreta striolata TaxID=444603 RepID=A0A9N9TMC9_PHYSR|nr:unnamed protein product [Phyllotreta striolata]
MVHKTENPAHKPRGSRPDQCVGVVSLRRDASYQTLSLQIVWRPKSVGFCIQAK